jgi:hypothetical protein
MDELYWDIFRAAHETWDDKLFSEAQELFPQCPCRRSDASNPRCVRCKLLSLFARRQLSNDLPRERKSTLEIVSSPANHTSPEWSEHRTDVATTSPRQALDEEHEGLPLNGTKSGNTAYTTSITQGRRSLMIHSTSSLILSPRWNLKWPGMRHSTWRPQAILNLYMRLSRPR